MQEGRTPLHHASQAGKEAAVAALLEAKADVNSTDKVRRVAIGTFTCRCFAFDDFMKTDYSIFGESAYVMALRNIDERREPVMHKFTRLCFSL